MALKVTSSFNNSAALYTDQSFFMFCPRGSVKNEISSTKVMWSLIYFIHEQRCQKLIYLHLFAGCFMKISPQSSGQGTAHS